MKPNERPAWGQMTVLLLELDTLGRFSKSFVTSILLPVSTILTVMGNFTIVNGQVYTPGLAIIDAPQPNTPLGGGKPTCQICSNQMELT